LTIATLHPALERPRPAKRGRERVELQRSSSRTAARRSAQLSGASIARFDKNADDVPEPHNGWHWSVSHDADWACAVVHQARVGVDLERIALRRSELIEYATNADERALFEPFNETAFMRVWTAKEAVLKTSGKGLLELSRCRLKRVLSATALLLDYRGQECRVEQFAFDEHIVSIHAVGDDWTVAWPEVRA